MVYFGTFNACGDGILWNIKCVWRWYILKHLMHVAMVYFETFNACGGDGIFWNI